jgi:ABC-type transport system involved in multi-copper enzyme maturation permease subunit
MAELLRANVIAHLTFYRKSRLLLAFLILFAVLTGLECVPQLFVASGVQNFNSLREIYGTLNFFLLLFAAGLGLFVISSHLRSRSLKMVFTKPCPPAVWLVSAFSAAVIVAFLLNGVVLGGMTVLSMLWHIPIRSGLIFISADTFIASIGLAAYLMLLATVVHPAIAAILAIIFNGDMFYEGLVWAQSAIRAGNHSGGLHAFERVLHFLYLAAPIVHPFGKETGNIYVSLRVMHGEWKCLLYSLGYSLALAAFCYLVALSALQRKRHI